MAEASLITCHVVDRLTVVQHFFKARKHPNTYLTQLQLHATAMAFTSSKPLAWLAINTQSNMHMQLYHGA
jgi:hypothetical protein